MYKRQVYKSIDEIKPLKETNNIEEEITNQNAESFLQKEQTLLTKENLESEISSKLESIFENNMPCLLYTSDAADERSSVDLGGRRIIKKKKNKNKQRRSPTRKR
mgnify:CR=1 FL=1